MAKKFVLATIALTILMMLCLCVQHTSAMSEGIFVTKETQAQLGLNYTLAADRVDDKAVLVRMEIPTKGKLKDLKRVNMTIGQGRPLVSAALQTTPGKNGCLVVSFRLSPDLADKCSIDLVTTRPTAILSNEFFYAVELKGYVTVRK